MISVTQLWSVALAVVGLILTVLNIADKIITMRKNANAPLAELQEKLVHLELEVADLKRRLLKGNDAFRKQKKINTLFERVNLAFIDFEIAYCHNTGYTNTESLMKAKSILEEILTNDSDLEEKD